MDDTQQVLVIAGIVMPLVVIFAAFLIRVNRELALRRQHDEQSEGQHEEIKSRLTALESSSTETQKDVSWIKGKLNGKH